MYIVHNLDFSGQEFEVNNTQSETLHRSTERVLDVLELIASTPGGYTLSGLSSALSIPKSTLSPILHTLLAKEYISIDAQQHYSIGLSIYQLGHNFLDQFHFPTEAESILATMTSSCMEASHFGVLRGGDVFYLRKINSPQPIRMVSSVGATLPAYSTAIGKALLIDLSASELKLLYPNGLKPVTSHTITDINVLCRELERARTEGFTYEIEESNEFIRCIGAPVRKNDKCVAAISIAVPTFRYNEEKAALIRQLLSDASAKLEHLMDKLNLNLEDLIDS